MAVDTTRRKQNDPMHQDSPVEKAPLNKGLPYAYRGLHAVGNGMPKSKEFYGTPSIFNPKYALFRYEGMQGNNELLFDIEGQPSVTSEESKYPSIERIMEWQTTRPNTPYHYSDFLYATNYGKAPNNRMITLRRYPVPIFDNPTGPHSQPAVYPIAQAVTFFGEDVGNKLDELLSFSCGLKWRELASDVQDMEGNELGDGDQPLSGLAKVLGVVNQYTTGSGKAKPKAEQAEQEASRNLQPGGPWSNKVYGPVNSIDRTMVRDQGLEYNHPLTLTFEYSLKSIGNINPKMAMLDLLANILAIVYNNARFWGGAVRYWPNKEYVYPFLGDQQKWFSGDPVGYMKSVVSRVAETGGNLGNFFSQLLNPNTTMSAIKSLLTNGLASVMGNMQAKGTFPNVIGHKALLTGQPTGEWHVVIGNPMNPIAMIGNLICKDAQFEFNDVLGADDFPTKLKVRITLDHGRPRDAGDIHSMFNLGGGRFYYPYAGHADALNSSYSTTNNVPDTGGTGGEHRVSSKSKEIKFDEFKKNLEEAGTAVNELYNQIDLGSTLVTKMGFFDVGDLITGGNKGKK